MVANLLFKPSAIFRRICAVIQQSRMTICVKEKKAKQKHGDRRFVPR
ncbi:hypothetical protein IEQ44_16135, partial [Nocardioides sp. Y6]|nr:hypothetical protein [Nocardioides malaquae]